VEHICHPSYTLNISRTILVQASLGIDRRSYLRKKKNHHMKRTKIDWGIMEGIYQFGI
jgi:hypothetical protein